LNADADGEREPQGFSNFSEVEVQSKDKDGRATTKTVCIGLPIDRIKLNLLDATGGWPKRVGPLLFAPAAEGPLYLESDPEKFAWIAGRLGGTLSNPIRWADGQGKVTKAEFCAYLGRPSTITMRSRGIRTTRRSWDTTTFIPRQDQSAARRCVNPRPLPACRP